jgi:hypothetical protein
MISVGLGRALAGCGGLQCVKGIGQKQHTHGRQGKRPAFGAAHVVGKTEEFAHVTNTPCWRFRQIVERFQCPDRRRGTAEPASAA